MKILELLFPFRAPPLRLVPLSSANPVINDLGQMLVVTSRVQLKNNVKSEFTFSFNDTVVDQTEYIETWTIHGRGIWKFSNSNLCVKQIWLEQVAQGPLQLNSL